MAAFSTVAAADLRAIAKGPAGDNTWMAAHGGVTFTGSPCVRVIRWLTSALSQGAWVEITDDGTT